MTLRLCISCTKRKRLPSAPELVMRGMPKGSAEDLAALWHQQAREVQDRVPAAELYGGIGWQNAMAAYQAAGKIGDTRLSVISAGFGLVDSTDFLPGYAATFATEEDRISDKITNGKDCTERHRIWWNALNTVTGKGEMPCAALGENTKEEVFIFSLGKDYLEALHDDLMYLAQKVGSDRLYIICLGGVNMALESPLKDCVIPLDLRIEGQIPGPRTGINPGATAWLLKNVIPVTGWLRPDIHQFVEEKLTSLSAPQRRVGVRRTEDWVRGWLLEQLEGQVSAPSASTLLNEFRNSGNGFEERRFRSLYHQMV